MLGLIVFIILSNGTSDASLTPTVTSAINSTTLLDMKIIVSAMTKTLNGNVTVFFLSSAVVAHRSIINSDYNFVRNGDECVPVGPEPIPAGVCTGDPDQLYKGSSGWRKIPGNTCVGGLQKDEKIDKKCSQGVCWRWLRN